MRFRRSSLLTKVVGPWCVATFLLAGALLAFSTKFEQTSRFSSFWFCVSAIVAATLLSAFSAWLVVAFFLRPVQRAVDGLERRRRDGESDIPITYPDELGRAICSLNAYLRESSRQSENYESIQRRLSARELELAELVDHASVGMQRLDANGTIAWTNRRLLDALGYAADDFLGRPFAELFADAATAERFQDYLRHRRRIVNWTIALRAKDGKTREFQFDAAPVSDDAGAQCTRCFLRDVTESLRIRRELERNLEEVAASRSLIERQAAQLSARNEELDLARTKAEAATESKSRFLANMSHELRTPLTAILGFGDTLLDAAAALTIEQRSAVETIVRNGRYLLELIDDILDLSKIEAGRMAIEKKPCMLRHVVAAAVEAIRPRATTKGLALEIEYGKNVPASIETDATRFRQILLNLLSNAVKFTPQGSVRMRVMWEAAATAPLCVEVVDTGIGMTDEQVAGLFQPFMQADASTTRKFGGTGLGLSICRRLAQMLGGEIAVSSREGEGSRFTLRIAARQVGADDPRDAVAATPVSAPSPSLAPAVVDGRELRLPFEILLAEDGPDNQRLISFLLRRVGANVDLVENGQAALDAALERRAAGRPYDLILMDMQMPVMDGYTAVRQLREAGYELPIVALTAHAMTQDRERCLAAGCSEYEVKPIDRTRFFETLRRVLNVPLRCRPLNFPAATI